ncbi:hypothetical protein T11_3167 [Trichinella zimbabwensis]|uniref:Uncharacterized protein n=1 Tax=Trichinella zimbabwensis TaxID=268475 RepID=A0A0V1HTK9_9BILA|nr:hypothetical protein T11_3167 [Trichinella zimbabwensis]
MGGYLTRSTRTVSLRLRRYYVPWLPQSQKCASRWYRPPVSRSGGNPHTSALVGTLGPNTDSEDLRDYVPTWPSSLTVVFDDNNTKYELISSTSRDKDRHTVALRIQKSHQHLPIRLGGPMFWAGIVRVMCGGLLQPRHVNELSTKLMVEMARVWHKDNVIDSVYHNADEEVRICM